VPQFRYMAATNSAETIEGRMEAATKAAVVDRLHAQGHVPIRVEQDGGSAIAALLATELFTSHRVGARALALITAQLATLLKAGIALDEALSIVEELVQKPSEKAAIRSLLEKISGGATLADAMAAQPRIFPEFYVSMVRAGEAGATLEAVLDRVAEFLERSEATRDHIKSTLTYPAIVAVTCCLSIAVLLAFVIPRFRPLFEQHGGKLPSSAAWLMASSDFLENWWWLCLLLPVVAALVFRHRLRDPAVRHRWQKRVLRLPIVGDLVTKIEVARLSRTLGTLLKNGVSLVPALTITQETAHNRVFGEAIAAIIELAKTGKGMAEPMRLTKVFPSLAIHLVRVGEESGRQDDMLLKIADIFDTESRRSIDRLMALMAPAVTIILGAIVAAVVMSIMTALLSVYELTI
jgi:general secretion pathway protein F